MDYIFFELDHKSMGPVLLFVIMAIIVCVFILVASITASIGATDAFNSSYNGANASGVIVADPKISNAAQYLIIAAALGWTALVLLVVILIIGAVAGAFPRVEVSKDLLQMNILTKDDLVVAYRGERELTAGQTMEIIILVVLIMIAIIILAIVILAAVAATEINNMKARDGNADTAYTMAIVTAASAAVSLIAMVVAIVAYFYIRSNRLKEARRLEALIQRSESSISSPTYVSSGTSSITVATAPSAPAGYVSVPTASSSVGVPANSSIAVTTSPGSSSYVGVPSNSSIAVTTFPGSPSYVGVPSNSSIAVTTSPTSVGVQTPNYGTSYGSIVDVPRAGSVAVTTL